MQALSPSRVFAQAESKMPGIRESREFHRVHFALATLLALASAFELHGWHVGFALALAVIAASMGFYLLLRKERRARDESENLPA